VVSSELDPVTRHYVEQARAGELAGAPLSEVRRVRDDIDRRVQALLTDLLPAAQADEG
jgi:hypothetical protein